MADLIGRHIKAVTLHEKSEKASFIEKLKNRTETLFWKSAKCKDQEDLIPKMTGKAKGDKLSESHQMTKTHQPLVS